MLRRDFLTRLAAAAGAWLAQPAAQAASPVPRRFELQRSPVAGFQYHRGEALWADLAPGQALVLLREPDNPYDPKAVRVDWNGQKIGYVPRIENTAVAHLMDQGLRLEAEILALRESRDPWSRVQFTIHLLD